MEQSNNKLTPQEKLYQWVLGIIFILALLAGTMFLMMPVLIPALIMYIIALVTFCEGTDFIREKIKEGK